MRRIHVSAATQLTAFAVATASLILALFATFQIASNVPAESSRDVAVARMTAKVAAMEREMATIRTQATEHARRLDVRQAFLDAVLTGNGNPGNVLPVAVSSLHPHMSPVIAPLAHAEDKQTRLAQRALAATDQQYRSATAMIGKLGLDAGRFRRVAGAMGGPLEPLPAGPAMSTSTSIKSADPQFRALFQSWKRLETLQRGIVAIPSQRPIDAVTFTSGFGVRSDPFRGGAAMHAGVDMPGATGTPIYATADGIVGRAQWANGYGNLVELDHGKGIQTRYGHLSAILVAPGARVARGQMIARMGSTGRSTGPHLHYEVRLDGHAVNPMPFLQSASYLTAMQKRSGQRVALGGPGE